MSRIKTIQKFTAMLLSIIMAVGMTPVSAAPATAEVTYVDENGVSRTVAATVIENKTTVLTSDWYVVEGSVNTTNLTLENHHVKLILTDGCTLTASATGDKAAIELFNGNTLTIYGQALGTGTLTATGSRRGAGIGGSGGADGSTTGEGQAGQAGGDSGALTVVGGRVIADRIGGGDGGEGISQNEGKKDGGRGGGGGTITVKGGSLEVSGKVGGGNGGESQYLRGGDGGRLTDFTVTGGMVNVGSISGGNGGNGIHETSLGGGISIAVGIAGNGGSVGSVSVSGGSVNVSGKLGGGDAGRTSFHSDSPGNGGGGSALTVSGGTVRISGSIGGGSNSPLFGSSSDHGSCIVTGGSLRAPSLRPTPTNGSANGNSTVLATTVKLDGISSAMAVKHLITGTAYTYGTKDMLTDAEGNLFLWLPNGAVVTQANTESAAYSGTVAAGETGTLTEVPLDTEKPTALSITPADGTTDVPDSGSISVTFSEVMAPSAGTVSLSLGEESPTILTGGTWSSSNLIYTIPYSRLSYGGVYTITISGFQDLAGNVMEDNSSCSFQVKILPIYDYVDEAGIARAASAIKMDSTTTGLTSGWYAAQDSLTLTNLSVSGNVHLILTDGCALTVNGTENNAAVRVTGGGSLTIYGETLGTGTLTATSAGRGAGIGGNGGGVGYSSANGEASGAITFNGGTVTTNRIGGGDGSDYLLLSGFHGGGGGTVTINGGIVIVSDRIGGGDGGDGTSGGGAGGNGGNGSSLTIRGGNVSVAGKIGGGAAGSGYSRNPITGKNTYGTAGGAGSCTITGGSIKASVMQPTPGNGDLTVSLTTVTLNGVSALRTIQAIVTNLLSTYGIRDMKTDASGRLYLWLPSGTFVTEAFSQGSRYTGSIPAGTSGTLVVSGAVPEVPVITSIVPVDGATEVPVNGSISVTFNGVMNVRAGSIVLMAEDLDPVALTSGIWTHSGRVYTVSYSGLSYGTEYTLTLSGFQDAYGQVVSSESLAFTTVAPPKSVTVGAQSGTLIRGTAGSVAFPITVVSIADGTYSVTLDGAPDGVTTEDITIASGSGALTVNASADTPEGSYTMTATIDGTLSDSFILTVSAALPTVDSVSVSPATAEVQKGATQQFAAAVAGTNHPAQTVTWEVIGNVSSATGIDASGLLTIGADETAASLTVKATSTVDIGISGSATVTVTEVPSAPVYRILLGYIFPAAVEGYGAQTPLTVPVTNTGNQPTGDLTVALGGSNHGDFILSKTVIGSIAASGSDCLTVTPKNGLTAGTYAATVTVSGGNGINKSFDMSFTVNSAPSSIAVTGITLDKSILSLAVGGHSTLVATVEPSSATNKAISWSSSDPSVAIVDNNGAVTAVSIGTAIITVTTEDGNFTTTCIVTVFEAAPVTTYTVTFDLNGGIRTGGGRLTQTVVHGDSAAAPVVTRSGHTFTGWNKAFSSVTSNLTVTATWSKNSSGSDDTGNSGVGGYTPSTPPTASITTDKKPGQPTIASINLTAAVDKDNIASVTITKAQAKALIDMAKKDAKAQGKAANGIGVSITIGLPDTAKSFSTILSQAVLGSLIDAGVKQLEINGRLVCLTLDLEALKEIQRQSTGDVTVTVKPVQNLSEAAKKLIGARPVYDVTVRYVRDGKTVDITSLGKGSAIFGIPYTPGKNEAAGFLYAVYVDGKGKISRILGSAYDATSRSMIFSTNHFSVYGVGYTEPSAKFTDISTHWAKDSIDYVVGRGLFDGGTDGKFQPDTDITRGDFVTALGRLSDVNVSGYKTSSFTDIKVDSYYMPYVEWAYEKGIIQGIGNNRFTPNRAIIREEIAVILQDYAKVTGYKLPVTSEATVFADASSIGAAYKSAVTAMQQAGIMLGEQNNNFNPKANATRAEASAMLHRYIKLTIDPATARGWALNDDGQYCTTKTVLP